MPSPKVRELRIAFPANSKQPSYTFQGEWTGFEVSSIIRGLSRAYHLHTRQLRRDEVRETSSNSTKETGK